MKKCKCCGSENKNQSNFCHNCGYDLNNENFTSRFKKANPVIKIIIILIAAFLFLAVFTGSYIFMGFPMDDLTQDNATYSTSEFDNLDVNRDGVLNFSEIEAISSNISPYNLTSIYNLAYENNDGVLNPSEFDRFNNQLEKPQKVITQKTHSQPVKNTERCPSCGSGGDNIYEYFDEFGNPYYQCSVCDYETYDEGDFYVE